MDARGSDDFAVLLVLLFWLRDGCSLDGGYNNNLQVLVKNSWMIVRLIIIAGCDFELLIKSSTTTA